MTLMSTIFIYMDLMDL